MFIRIKKIKNKRYAYLVKNTWSKRKKSSKQKVIKYLGPIHTLKKESYKDFETYYKIKDLNSDIAIFPSISILKKLLTLELINHGFKKRGRKLKKENITINLSHKTIIKNNKPILLELNEGFLSTYTLTKLYNFKTKTFNQKEEATNFANTILQAGITLDPELFIHLFNKVYKKAEPYEKDV